MEVRASCQEQLAEVFSTTSRFKLRQFHYSLSISKEERNFELIILLLNRNTRRVILLLNKHDAQKNCEDIV